MTDRGAIESTALRLLDAALDEMANVIRVAAETTAADAIEHLADWMNAHDAVGDDDPAAFARWVERGRQ